MAVATAAAAQTAQPPAAPPTAESAAPLATPAAPNSAANLNLPQTVQLFGNAIPSVVKATAIINGEVITQTDVDQRLALLAIAQEGKIPADQIDELRQQVLRNLIDETLQIQAARHEEISVKASDIDRTVQRVARDSKRTPEQLAEYLKANGSSIRSIRRQIEGEIAWRRLQQARIENSVSVGDDEVKAVLDRLNAAKGTTEYRVGEIFVSAAGIGEQQAQVNAARIFEQLKQGASFAGYARQYSEASTAAVGGDLGWVRPEQLPAQLATVLQQMGPGNISNPIAIPGGFSILAVSDVRKVLSADPRNAVLSLKQLTVPFPAGSTREQVEPIIARFAAAVQNIGGCGGAERIANEFNAEIVQSDQVQMRDLPAVLQEIMLPMQVGQATRPFAAGTIEEGVRVLVLCGRDEVSPTAPTFDTVLAQLSEDRVNSRARRYLRDLRRDAVIEFR
ncbi:MAG TPA: peptidylprolyl isomerase [Sphingomicrobium sp.]|nr:peptidylprolyl isomerase [Sphingomicrobium sp.]